MKQILKSAFLISSLFTLLFVPSCQTACDNGYEGKRCDVPWRDKFRGVWSATDVSGSVTLTYLDTITDAGEIADVNLSRSFCGNKFPRTIKATVNANGISLASKPGVADVFVEGTGTINSEKTIINWNYKVTTGKSGPAPMDTLYTGVWIKQ